MANIELSSRLILCSKTKQEWAAVTTIIMDGELCIEKDTRRAKIGDGTKMFSELKYMNITPEEVETLIQNASHTHDNKQVLDSTTASFTTTLKDKLDKIASGAEVNVQADWTDTDPASDAYIKHKPESLPANGGDATTVNGHTVESNVPVNAKFTDTTYGAGGGHLASLNLAAM